MEVAGRSAWAPRARSTRRLDSRNRPGLRRDGFAEVGEFAEYLGETFGCDEIVELSREQDHSSGDLTRAVVVCDEFESGRLASAMATAPVGVLVRPPRTRRQTRLN